MLDLSELIKIRNFVGYNNRITREFTASLLIVGVLMAIASSIYSRYEGTARLLDAFSLADGIRINILIDSALTGNRSVSSDYYQVPDNFSRNIKHITFSPNGNFQIALLSDHLGINNKVFGFNIGSYNVGQGYIFSRLSCGNLDAYGPYEITNYVESTVPAIYSDTICKR